MTRLEQVQELGARVNYEQIYGGTPGVDRKHRDDLSHITRVLLPLSDEEWCYICMRERDGYIGPCCGNTGRMQDIINGYAFRDGGWIDGGKFLELGLLARGHEGFDTFEKVDDEEFTRLLGLWGKLEAWDKIGLIFLAVEDKLQWDNLARPHIPDEESRRSAEEDAFYLLDRGLASISWKELFGPRGIETLDCQDEANTLVMKARILQPAIMVAEQLKADVEHFEGAAIVEKETGEILKNNNGYCIYRDEEQAKEILALMTRWEKQEREEDDDPIREHIKEQMIADRVFIAPVRVSVAGGIEVLAGAPS